MKNYKYLYGVCIIIYVVTLMYAVIKGSRLQMCIIAGILPCLLPVLKYKFHCKITYEVKIIYLAFIYFSSLIGSCLGGYALAYYDKIVHFFSGIIITMLACLIYSFIKKNIKIQQPSDQKIYYIFIMTFNMSIALLWEFYEYAMLIFFQNDCIHHYTTGIHDSMIGMICACLGSLIILYQVVQYHRKNKKYYSIKVMHQFYNQNIL